MERSGACCHPGEHSEDKESINVHAVKWLISSAYSSFSDTRLLYSSKSWQEKSRNGTSPVCVHTRDQSFASSIISSNLVTKVRASSSFDLPHISILRWSDADSLQYSNAATIAICSLCNTTHNRSPEASCFLNIAQESMKCLGPVPLQC